MKILGRLSLGAAALAALLGALAEPAHAHEKWFVGEPVGGLRWDLLLRPLPLTLVGAVLLVTLLGGLLWRARGRGFLPVPEAFGATDGGRSLLYGLVPLILGIHVAVPLLVNGVQGTLFSPDNEMPGVWTNFLGLAEAGIALALFYGGLTRMAAAALGLLWFAGIFLVGLEPMLENVLYLGFAAFFLLAGRGPLSVDRLLFPRLEPRAELSRYAVPAVRVGVGLSLAFVAFTEKFANVSLGLSFLGEYPLNFTDALGMPLTDEAFVLCAGAVELLVGLWLALGIFVREVVVVAWFPINLTLTLFAWEELIGHLPIYGVMAVLLVWGTGPKNLSLWTEGLRERLLPLTPSVGYGGRRRGRWAASSYPSAGLSATEEASGPRADASASPLPKTDIWPVPATTAFSNPTLLLGLRLPGRLPLFTELPRGFSETARKEIGR